MGHTSICVRVCLRVRRASSDHKCSTSLSFRKLHLGGEDTGVQKQGTVQRLTEGMEGVVREVLRREQMDGATEGRGEGCAEAKDGVGKWMQVCTVRLSRSRARARSLSGL